MSVEKQAIRAAFGKAATAYDSVAEVQRRIARKLLAHTPASKRILDAGCGTGYGVRLLQSAQPDAQIHALDAALPMCASLGRSGVVCADIEALPFADHCLDLYWSSLAWQWTLPELASAEAARVLTPGGYLRVASLGPDTLGELRSVFSQVDAYRHVREFHSLERHTAALEAAGFADIQVLADTEYGYAPNLGALLRDIRSLGAHELGGARRPGLLGRSAWQTLQTLYEAYRCEQGLPVSYDVLYITARKP